MSVCIREAFRQLGSFFSVPFQKDSSNRFPLILNDDLPPNVEQSGAHKMFAIRGTLAE